MLVTTTETISTPRNLRLLFFVTKNINTERLKEIMTRNLRLWGGGFNPVILVSNNSISDDWRSFARYFDPDYIYRTDDVDLDFVIQLSEELKLNPLEILRIDETPAMQIKGVNSQYLLKSWGTPTNFLQANTIYDWENPLREYYSFNYLLDQSYQIADKLIVDHKTVEINKNNIHDFDKIIFENNVTNYCLLSMKNADQVNLRLKDPKYSAFEIIIADKADCFEELIYQWNRKFYELNLRPLSSIFITLDQLDEAIKTTHFKQTLFSSSGNDKRIDIVSFNLNNSQLGKVHLKLENYATHSQFKIKDKFSFPFEIQDNEGIPFMRAFEKKSIQMNITDTFIINIPSLSFNEHFNCNMHEYAVDIEVSRIDEAGRNLKKFPLNTKTHSILLYNKGRIDKRKKLVAIIDESRHKKTILNINMISFMDNIEQIITSPFVLNKDNIRHYYRCAFNDGSNRLKQFFKLFNDNFENVREFMTDKFWYDLFFGLSDNSRSEGDTITFNDIFQRCFEMFSSNSLVFGEYPATRFNKENLIKGLKATLQELIENKIFLAGYVLKCSHCSSKTWYSLNEINLSVTCKGCSANVYFEAEKPISYKLNHLVKNNFGMKDDKGIFHPDGNLTTIRTLLFLKRKSIDSFEFLPQIDIYKHHKDRKPKTDLDIVSLVDGKLYIGECKHTSSGFSLESNKSLNNLLEIAMTVKPDVLIIASTVDVGGKLEKSKMYLEGKVHKWAIKPEIKSLLVSSPKFPSENDGKYFFH